VAARPYRLAARALIGLMEEGHGEAVGERVAAAAASSSDLGAERGGRYALRPGASCRRMQSDLPSGTVTFLFTDVEGSTKLLHELGAASYAQVLSDHRRVLREAFAAQGGVEVDTQGDAFFVAFPTPTGALAAAIQTQEGLAAGPFRVRMGIHTGTPLLGDEGYVGVDVHRAARIAAVGHGRQVLLSASAASLLGAAALRDLGEHRLKDLAAPERIYQLGEEQFPPLKSLYRTNLPVPATAFLGRERELAELRGLLSNESIRLLTLTGPGGTGKTRLGLQAAADAADRYPSGIFWVPLASLRDPELVLETAGQVLGANDGLAEHIADQSLLLLFDNFEHVVDAAEGVSGLLASCPNLRLLVTSRELLRVPGEQAYPVPPLEPEDGRALFAARARAADPRFAGNDAVAELCERLDNLPLALELAAARARVLSPEQLLGRLSERLDLLRAGRGVDPRQQTLRATIEWSHDLLDVDEQRLFARFAVFRGGCTLEAAEEVCDAGLDTLQSLVDKSLVRVREGDRFWMLETIREYAAERLELSGGAEELRGRHADYFLARAEQAERRLREDDHEAFDRFDRDHDNVRAALDTYEAREPQLALRLAAAASWYWAARGHLPEGRRRLDAALSADERPTAARAKALNGAAELAGSSGDPETFRHRAEAALALHRELADPWGTALSLFELGCAASIEGDRVKNRADESAPFYRAALPYLEQSLELFDELGDEHYALLARYQRSYVQIELGDGESGRIEREEILRRARAVGDEYVEALALGGLVRFAFDEDRHDDALLMLRELIVMWRRLGDLRRVAVILGRLAYPLAQLQRPEAATQLLARSLGLFEETGASVPWTAVENEETLAVIRTQLDQAAFDAAWERGRALTVDDAIALALAEP
jgi:predicted ATPase/class 3 adenylate cyclase